MTSGSCSILLLCELQLLQRMLAHSMLLAWPLLHDIRVVLLLPAPALWKQLTHSQQYSGAPRSIATTGASCCGKGTGPLLSCAYTDIMPLDWMLCVTSVSATLDCSSNSSCY
jgi:hypothetical protein